MRKACQESILIAQLYLGLNVSYSRYVMIMFTVSLGGFAVKYLMTFILLHFIWLHSAIAETETPVIDTMPEESLFNPSLEVPPELLKSLKQQIKQNQTSLKKLRRSSPQQQKQIQKQLANLTDETQFSEQDVN